MRMRQLRTTLILLILIGGVIFSAFYFEKHPFLENVGRPTATPAPQPSPTFHSFNPMRTEEVKATATPAPTKDPEAEIGEDMAEVVTRLYTSEEGVIFTFNYSPENGELPSVLETLEDLGAPAVFFIKPDDLAQFTENAAGIIRAGHEMGILMEKDSRVTAARQLEIVKGAEEQLRTLGYTGEVYVRTAYGTPTDVHRQAAASGGYQLISFLEDVTPTNISRLTDAAQITEEVFSGYNRVALQRGEIISFQMGLFQYSETVLADYIRAIAENWTVYPVKSLGAMQANTDLLYHYPLTDEEILPEVLDLIYPGHLDGVADSMTEIEKRYIGVDWVKTPGFLPGFSDAERARLDKTGLIKNENNHVFLTFDDWGPDETITGLLRVLEKHGAKAVFFVRTNNVDYNPNLLRAIAMAGHTVASHTDAHLPLSHDTGNGRVYESLTEEEAMELQADLVLSYEKLQRIIGDIAIDGQPALVPLFRPPTLAVSKIGLETVLDCGFHYSVSGSFSTEDYIAKNAKSLYGSMLRNTKSGAVLVMHMSQNSLYTAEAVDMLLTEMEKRKSPLKFVSLAEDLH